MLAKLNEVKTNQVKPVALKEYLVEYIEDFLYDCKMRSVKTYDNYKSDINKLSKEMFGLEGYQFLERSHFEGLTVDDTIKYFRTVSQEEGPDGERLFSNSTLNRRISSFKSITKYLTARGAIEYPVNQMLVLLKALPKQSERIAVLSIEDSDACIEHFKQMPKGDILSLMAKLSVDTALRASELLKLEWKQFRVHDDVVVIQSDGAIKGKGGKDYRDVISLALYDELLTIKQEDSPKVFNISYSYVTQNMSRVLEELGLTEHNYSFHSFRKRSLSNVVALTGDIYEAKKKGRHSSIATTELYLEDTDYGMTGYYSLGDVDTNLFEKASHEELIEAIKGMSKGYIHLLNIKLSQKK